ncbi:hypothetical protein Tco_0687766 [Tanacetum coccineum]
MASVVLMLGNENALPPPKEPAFFAEEEMPGLGSISSGPTLDSRAHNISDMDLKAANQQIKDGETISNGGMFELNLSYGLRIETKRLRTHQAGHLPPGALPISAIILNGGETVIGLSNSFVSNGTTSLVAKLLDIPEIQLMKFGRDIMSGKEREFTSWKSLDDPLQGLYVLYMETNGYPQAFHERCGSVTKYRFKSGPRNGLRLSGFPSRICNINSSPVCSCILVWMVLNHYNQKNGMQEFGQVAVSISVTLVLVGLTLAVYAYKKKCSQRLWNAINPLLSTADK